MSSKKKKNVPKASSASKMKQGSLFSFFTRLPAKENSSKTTKSPAGTGATKEKSQDNNNNNNNNKAIVQNGSQKNGASQEDTRKRSSSSSSAEKKTPVNSSSKVKDIKENMKIAVFWPDDGKYYPATVTEVRPNNFHLLYEDGENEWIDLRFEKFRFIDDEDDDDGLEDTDDEFEEGEPKKPTTQGSRPSKRPRISDSDDDDDDDEEFEMDDAPEDDDLEVDDCIVDSDEEDIDEGVPVSAKKKNTKKRKPAQKANSSTQKAVKATPKVSVSTPATSAGTNTTTPTSLASFSAFSQTTTGNNNTNNNSSGQVTPSPMTKTSDVAKKLTDTKEYDLEDKPMPYIQDGVNPCGSHIHNHLKFLRKPRDIEGRSPGQPGYSCRTLKVDHKELQKHYKSKKLSPGTVQWWDTKAQYFDTVLLFKTGKFYELYHMDADIGVEVCNLSYMKGAAAHAGFPEISYGPMADKLVRAGYKVARCEQTETPDDLKQRRKKKTKNEEILNVVNREVASIMTIGTRTFCYLDGDEALNNSGGAGMGPLLAIKEKLLDNPDQEDGGVVEYGVVAVDAARAEVTMGQFSDDALRGRLTTLLATFEPSEVLIEGGERGASPELRSALKSIRDSSSSPFMIEDVLPLEAFPKSTALDANIKRRLERNSGKPKPWDVEETMGELHRRGYFPRASRQNQGTPSTSRWPVVLRSAVDGGANLALSSLGAALFWLQRGLLDEEIMSMGLFKAYIPAECPTASPEDEELDAATKEQGLGIVQTTSKVPAENTRSLALDGNCLCQLEILSNSVDHTEKGSLWSKINFTKSPHGSRLLRAWLLRPLFQKADIDRRADAVEELATGDLAMAMEECRQKLAKMGDIERLLARIHSMSGYPESESENQNPSHPNVRAILYETKKYTKRKVDDFSKVLNGLREASKIPELFRGVQTESALVTKLVKTPEEGGCFPDIAEELDWFFNVFDFDKAASGEFEPNRGVDPLFDEACEAVESIHSELDRYKEEVCSSVLTPRGEAKRTFKFINTGFDAKDKFVIELPKSVSVPQSFKMVGKRGKGHSQICKYKSDELVGLIESLEAAIELHKKRKAEHMQHIFAQFDAKRNLWEQVKHATAMLDALGSLAVLGSKPGYCRPEILDCPPDGSPCIDIVQGRHPCVESTPGSGEFIPNDLALGSREESVQSPLVLLLSGSNMGGKSTLLRQTCLICIMAQIGGFVPADSCRLTPVDRIMTRLGASDRILLGHSTFFCELFETASALRQATRRSLIIFDELGRGTSSFDGTAIASACLSYIVSTLKCACLFATHYHSLLDEKKSDENVRLGHMENTVNKVDDTVTFHYTLGDGACPASFGINVAKLASLPDEVLKKAKAFSSKFELESVTKKNVMDMVKDEKLSELEELWESMQGNSSEMAEPTE